MIVIKKVLTQGKLFETLLQELVRTDTLEREFEYR